MATALAEPASTDTLSEPEDNANTIHLPDEAATESSTSLALTTTTSTNVPKKTKKIIRVKKKRPARPQVDPATFNAENPAQTGTVFNIWYGQWNGGDSSSSAHYAQHAAPSRCNIKRDSGFTRADGQPGAFFCLKFARGVCPLGRDCEYLHRLPTVTDMFNPNVDCFGREKFADYRDDMGGVGSFLRVNRTLYVGRVHVTDDIEEVVARHFAEWGPLERSRVLARGIAFVTYAHLANSEFAKEAMAHQALDHDEVLNVRWATVDPNPAAQKRDARLVERQAAEAIRAALPPAYVAELEGRLYAGEDGVEARKRRKIEGSFGLEGYHAPEEVWYAKQKGDWIAQQQNQPGGASEVSGSRLLIEDNGEKDEEDNTITEEDQRLAEDEQDGIFSASTLKALQSRQSMSGAIYPVATEPVSNSGPLIGGYDSDSENDENEE